MLTQAHQRRDCIRLECRSGSLATVAQQDSAVNLEPLRGRIRTLCRDFSQADGTSRVSLGTTNQQECPQRSTTWSPKGSTANLLQMEELAPCPGSVHLHNLRVVSTDTCCFGTGAVTAPSSPHSPPIGFRGVHAMSSMHPLERVRLDHRTLSFASGIQGTSARDLNCAIDLTEGTNSSSGTSGNTSASTEDSSGSTGVSTLVPPTEPSMQDPEAQEQAHVVSVRALLSPRHGEHGLGVAKGQPIQHTSGCLRARGRTWLASHSPVPTGQTTGVQTTAMPVWTPRMRTYSSLHEARRLKSCPDETQQARRVCPMIAK